MTNRNKQKGTRFEVLVRDFLRASGFPDVFRLAQTGIDDEGDLHGHDIRDWGVECRDRKQISLAENIEDAKSRAACKGSKYGVAVIKRRGRPVQDSYVLMDLETWVRVLKELSGE